MDVKKIGILGAILTVGFIGTSVYGQYKTEENVERLLNNNSLNEMVHYDSVSFNPLTFTPSLNDVVVDLDSRTQIKFETISVHNYAFDKQTKQADIDVSYRLKEVPVSDAPITVKKALVVPTMLGLSTFASQGRISLNADGEELLLALSVAVSEIASVEFNLSAEYDLGDVNLNQNLGNVWLTVMLGGSSILEKVFIESINFELHDEGLLPEIASEIKKEEGYKPLKQSDEMIQLVDMIGLAKLNSSDAKEIASEMDDFISSPSELNISVNPDSPVSFDQIKEAVRSKQAYERLGMKISS